MELKNSHILQLDGLRAIAVLLVLFVHFGLLGLGWIGVQLFFVLSGYLITKGLLIEKQKEGTIFNFLKIFYIKRSLRIFPIYFLYISVFIFICLYYYQYDRLEKTIIPMFTYTINIYAMFRNHVDMNGIGHLWSLAVEEQFYLVWPFVIYYINLKFLKKTLFSILLIIPIFRLVLFYLIQTKTNDLHYAGELVYLNPLSHFDAFASGALIIFFEEKYKSFQIKDAEVILLSALTIVVFIGVFKLIEEVPTTGISFSYLSTGGFPHLMINNLGYFFGYTLLNLFFSILIFCVIKCPNILTLLKNKFLVYTGKISYGLYMYHVPVLIFIQHLKISNSLVGKISLMILYFGLTYLLATFSFKTVERYFMNFKQKLV